MLLYSVLHLAGVKQLDHDGQPTGELAVTLDEISSSASWTAAARPSRNRTDQRRRNHHRAARPGDRQQRRHGHRPRWLAAHYNRPGFDLFDFNVYALCSDGDLMEGISARPPRWPDT